MDKLIWRFLMWLWARRARKAFSPASFVDGASFNTACFQKAVRMTTGRFALGQAAREWLTDAGWIVGTGGCHWFRSQAARDRYCVQDPGPEGEADGAARSTDD